ncbi:MAG: AMP-binding protein [Candidatus Sulfotelmatobacter sp.]
MQFRSLIEALEAAPADRPFVTTWIDEDEQQTLTFADFRRRARGQAAVLRDHGVAVGDRVVIIMPQGIPAMTTFVGAMMLGAAPTFLAYPNFKIEPSKYRSGLAGVTANLKAKAVVIDEEFPDEMLGHVSLTAGTKLLRAGDGRDADKERDIPLPNIQAESLAFIQHSAGTTGLQKGVALTHAAVLRQLGHLEQALKIDGATDRVYSWLPLYHDMGLIACFMLPMVCHMQVVTQSPLDWVMHPESMLQIISEYRCTLAWLPNFAFQFVPRRTAQSRWRQYDLSSVRALINCSEPVRANSMLEFQKAFAIESQVLQSSYAMAENVFAVTQSDLNRPSGPARVWADGQAFRIAHRVVPLAEGTPGAIAFTSSGRLLPHHEVRIVSDSGTVLVERDVGEILVKSDCRFEGYYNRADLTAQAIVDGWYHTGDLGFLLQGELYVVGRKKDLLIIGGENIYPQDIEEIVASHSAIHDGRVIAMGVYNPDLGTEDIVVVAEVQREELLANAAEIEGEIRGLVVAGMGVAIRTMFLKPPKWIVKSTAGKAARSATREKLFQEHPELSVEPEERNVWMTEEALQMIEHVARLIRKPGVTLDENTPLVSSGLIDSMALVDLLLKLEDVTHMRIPAGKVQPKDLDTVAKMFATAQRVGKPRK